MRVLSTLVLLLASSPFIHSYSIPEHAKGDLVRRIADAEPESLHDALAFSDLEKRRGGGGGGGRGGGGSSGSSSGSRGSSSSTGSSGGGSSGGGGSSVSAPRPRVGPSYGGGRYFGGGATTPFRAGGRSPRGLTPFLLPVAAVALIFPGLWLYSAYAYNYNNPYYFRNGSRNAVAEPYPVQCVCQQYSDCGCDEPDDDDFLTSILPNGTDTGNLNRTLVAISDVNGTRTIVLNGTLPNSTAEESAGESLSEETPSAGARQSALEHIGWSIMIAVVGTTLWLI